MSPLATPLYEVTTLPKWSKPPSRANLFGTYGASTMHFWRLKTCLRHSLRSQGLEVMRAQSPSVDQGNSLGEGLGAEPQKPDIYNLQTTNAFSKQYRALIN